MSNTLAGTTKSPLQQLRDDIVKSMVRQRSLQKQVHETRNERLAKEIGKLYQAEVERCKVLKAQDKQLRQEAVVTQPIVAEPEPQPTEVVEQPEAA